MSCGLLTIMRYWCYARIIYLNSMKGEEKMSTLKDVAIRAGVTVTTVSRVINNRGYISEKTRKKVQEAMKEIGYQPNEVARSLSKQCTNTIGVIVPHIIHPYFAKLISNIESVAAMNNYKIILCNSKENESNERKYVEMFKGNQVAGIILCSGTININEFLNLNIPVVTIECAEGLGNCNVQCDNYKGGILAAELLIKNGCKEIVHFSGVEKHIMPADRRCIGFREICDKYGVIHHEVETTQSSYNIMDYTNIIKNTLALYKNIDGIFASSDVIAAQSIQACYALEKKVPNDIKIIGFDDVSLAKLVTPQLTTIHQPVKEMAQLAVEVILKKRGGDIIPDKIILPVTVVERGTTIKVT